MTARKDLVGAKSSEARVYRVRYLGRYEREVNIFSETRDLTRTS
jgi:hypothetical protein